MSDRTPERWRRDGGFRPVAGLVVGVGTWAAGYCVSLLATVAFFAIGPQTGPPDPVVLAKNAGFVFYNSHFVPLDGTPAVENVVQSVGGVFLSLLVVVPVLVTLGGAVLARNRRDASTAGLSLVVGYCPATLVGLVLFRGELVDTVVVPNSLVATVVMALGYPLALGAAGGWLLERFDPDHPPPGPRGDPGPEPDPDRTAGREHRRD